MRTTQSAAPRRASHPAWMAQHFGLRRLALLTADDLEALAGALRAVLVPPGRTILEAGKEAPAAFVIEEGEVEIVARSGDRPTLVSIERTGSVLGDVPILFQMPVPFDAVARTSCTLLEVDRDGLVDMLRERPAIALRWLGNVVRRLDRANRRILSLIAGDLRSRTLALLAEAQGQGEGGDDGTPTVRLTQAELAAMMGASRQSVNRVLGQLAKERLIRTSYGEVEILDPDRVLTLAEERIPTAE
ncbi:MAG: Crp/Fnr family transcriptional regulator [Actinomycetota bacterium]